MAEGGCADFQSWLSSRLQDLNADDEVFSPYILSILEEGAGSEEAEVLDNLADVLGGLGLEDEDTQESLKGQIWSKWRQEQKSSEAKESCSSGVGGTSKVVDAATSSLKSHLASITEKVTEEYKAKASQKPANQSEIEARKAVKAAVMAQYQNGEIETDGDSDDDEDGGGGDGETEIGMMRNTNAEAVAKAEQEKREKGRLAAAAKKEKDKDDREKQKKQAEDKKKKAQEKAAKGERRR